MSYRIQFTISDAEHEELKAEALAAGYPSVSALCYVRAFPKTSTHELFSSLKEKVAAMEPGTKFVIRELFPDTRIPAILGRIFAESVSSGSIPNVRSLGRNSTKGAGEYAKL